MLIAANIISADHITTGTLDAARVTIGASYYGFEEGYDPSQNSATGMGADSNCTGLWHLDGSLNSHKGVSIDSDAEFGVSKWGQGLLIALGKLLKIPTADILDSYESSINFLVEKLGRIS